MHLSLSYFSQYGALHIAAGAPLGHGVVHAGAGPQSGMEEEEAAEEADDHYAAAEDGVCVLPPAAAGLLMSRMHLGRCVNRAYIHP